MKYNVKPLPYENLYALRLMLAVIDDLQLSIFLPSADLDDRRLKNNNAVNIVFLRE